MHWQTRLGSALAIALALAAPLEAAQTLPLAEVRPGMKGIGRTVFEGTRIEEFQVTILGVLTNVGPKQSVILARLTGGPLETTGVIAGMSGSPVLIDGKLVGAVAYGFPFSKETIAGITPIDEMLESARSRAPRAASARALPSRSGVLTRPLDRAGLVAALVRPLASARPDTAGALPHGGPLAPLPLPLVFSGIDPQTFEWARGVFSGLGFQPMVGTGGSAPASSAPARLEPGGAIALTLLDGDMEVSATGTVTHVDGEAVYAFGHPLFNLGPTQVPMRRAYVYSVFPSLYQSWKIAAAEGEPVGTIEQDRIAAVSGHMGKRPRMIPIDITLATSRGEERKYSFRMVEDELLSPLLAFVSLASVLQSSERALGTSTIELGATLDLAGGQAVEIEDIFASGQPATQASILLATPLAYLLSNDFEPVTVERVSVDVVAHETIRSAALERAWIERTGRLRPGSKVDLQLQLRGYRGEMLSETVPVTIPASAQPGSYTLLVADAPTVTAVEQREMRRSLPPNDLAQLIKTLNSLRRNNHLYFRLLRLQEGAVVSGELLQSLPPSVLSVMDSFRGDDVLPIRTASVWEDDICTDYAISGSRALTLAIER